MCGRSSHGEGTVSGVGGRKADAKPSGKHKAFLKLHGFLYNDSSILPSYFPDINQDIIFATSREPGTL
jgi:hypothetical protein